MLFSDLISVVRNDLSSIVQRLQRSESGTRDTALIDEEAVRAMLSRLETAKENYDPLTLHMQLSDQWPWEVQVSHVKTLSCESRLRAFLCHQTLKGGVAYNPRLQTPEILISDDLVRWDQEEVYYSCLSHLILGHPLPVVGDQLSVYPALLDAADVAFKPLGVQPLILHDVPFRMDKCSIDKVERTRYVSWAQLQADACTRHLTKLEDLGEQALYRVETLLGVQ